MKLVECVPNFSEGRRKEVIEAIASAGDGIKNTWRLDIESDPDHNRMLVTVVGEPEAVFQAVWEMVKKATELIDMTLHHGEHPRIGATDVVPFIPISEVTMDEAVTLAKRFGKKVAEELKIPVYLYEAAATRPDRVNLADVRRGEYEGLKKEIETNPDRKPDFGPAKFHPTAGAMVVGARKFLVAFNVNLDTKDVQVAKDIAKIVREKDGGFPAVKALAFEIKEKGYVQVSMNLCDFEKTNMDKVFRKIKEEAENRGVRVLNSEIYGMIPKAALKGINLGELQLINFKESQILENHLP
jgi:glutamate formiminotransferase